VSSKNDVYVAGYEYNEQEITVAKFWKNGIAQNLTNGKFDAFAHSIFVK
jgi:hypothetical protein